MREILFEGKRVDNGEWVCGDLIHSWHKQQTKSTPMIYNNMGKFEVIPETVGQYTGLTDKNGKKIFEGDIVRYDDWYGLADTVTAVVKIGEYIEEAGHGEYTKDCYGVYAEVVTYELPEWMDYFPDCMRTQNLLSVCKDCECEVIGTVADNPELLGVE